jgi:hypothetical protein
MAGHAGVWIDVLSGGNCMPGCDDVASLRDLRMGRRNVSAIVGITEMAEPLGDWERPYFQIPGGRPTLFYIAYGEFGSFEGFSVSKYRSTGVPEGFRLMSYGPDSYPEIAARFHTGYLWNDLQTRDLTLASRISAAQMCMILRGEIEDCPTLNYFRDCVGILTFLLDRGGIAIFDPYMFKWWEPDEWRQRAFDSASAVPSRHVVILTSEEPDPALTWYHTRGMRKFGRSDLSVHNVPAEHGDAIVDLCERFIRLQAFGGIIEEGIEIRMKALPPGMTCHHAGDLDDPDFNNTHVEIRWN